jgi:transcriptional regulator with XRE-family HTH domain
MAIDLSSIKVGEIDDSPAKTFGKRIRQLRDQLHLKQVQVIERIAEILRHQNERGIAVSYVSKIENEKLPPPSTPVILALAGALQADPVELLNLAGKTVPGLEGKLLGKPAARKFLEFALDHLSERDWAKLLMQIQRGKRKK